jgi:hypothetical protein
MMVQHKFDVDEVMEEWRHRQERTESERLRRETERAEQAEYRHKRRVKGREEEVKKKLQAISAMLTGPFDPRGLIFWFNHDTWSVNEALVLLCGFNPRNMEFSSEVQELALPNTKIPHDHNAVHDPLVFDPWLKEMGHYGYIRLDGLRLHDETIKDVLPGVVLGAIETDFRLNHKSILKLWRSGVHMESRYPPQYFINWAIQKRLQIDWLGWAVEKGYCSDGAAEPLPIKEDNLSSRERNNLLTIVAALCVKSGIDYKTKGAAAEVGRQIDAIGHSVGEDTIRAALKRIPDVLSGRQK